MDNKDLNKPEQISDEDLDLVTGGSGVMVRAGEGRGGKYYKYVGDVTEEALSAAYLCPKCGHTIAWGSGVWDWSAKCAGCGERWWFEDNVDLNLDSGLWKEVTHGEYLTARKGRSPRV